MVISCREAFSGGNARSTGEQQVEVAELQMHKKWVCLPLVLVQKNTTVGQCADGRCAALGTIANRAQKGSVKRGEDVSDYTHM